MSMGAYTSVALLLVTMATGGAVAAGKDSGTVAPKIRVQGGPRENCAIEATRIEKGLKGAKPFSGMGAVIVPVGPYRVRVECEGEPKLVGILEKVLVTKDKTTSPALHLEPARVRARAERNGRMISGEVRLYRPQADEDEAALYTFPANQSVEVAAARYDLIVSGQSDEGIVIEAVLEGASLPKGKLTAFTADLSDGQLVASAQENGRPAEAVIKVSGRSDTKRDLRVDAGRVVDLPPGRYVVETTLASTANFATKRQTVWVRSKKKTSVSESFETGRLSVSIEGEAPEPIARVGLPGAADDFTYFAVPDSVVLSPGEYRLRVEAKIDGPVKVQETRVVVSKGKETKHRARFVPGRLVVEVKRAGRRVEIQSISVRLAGGGKDAGQPNFDGEYVLWPGRYEIVATLANGDVLSDGPFEVQWGQKLQRTLEVSHGTLTVSAVRGGAVVAGAKIQVFKPGAAKATAELAGEGTVALSPGVYDLKVADGPSTKWQPGVRVHERKNTEVTLELEALAPAAGDPAMPTGDELPEGE